MNFYSDKLAQTIVVFQLPLSQCNTLHSERFLAPGLVRQVLFDVMSNSSLITVCTNNVDKSKYVTKFYLFLTVLLQDQTVTDHSKSIQLESVFASALFDELVTIVIVL